MDDGTLSDEEIAQTVGCHAGYVRCVRDKRKRRAAKALAKNSKQ
jgi:hypothetical protein